MILRTLAGIFGIVFGLGILVQFGQLLMIIPTGPTGIPVAQMNTSYYIGRLLGCLLFGGIAVCMLQYAIRGSKKEGSSKENQ